MKKFAFTLFFACVFVFSISVNSFADEGNIPTMGRNCPPNTACLVNNQVPTQTEKPTIFKTVLDYLAQLFG